MTEERKDKRVRVATSTATLDLSSRVTQTAALDQLMRMFLTFREMAISRRVSRDWAINALPSVVFGTGASGRAAVETKTKLLATKHVRTVAARAVSFEDAVQSFVEAVEVDDVETALKIFRAENNSHKRDDQSQALMLLAAPNLYMPSHSTVLDAVIAAIWHLGPAAKFELCVGILSNPEAADFFAATRRRIARAARHFSYPDVGTLILVDMRVGNMLANAVTTELLDEVAVDDVQGKYEEGLNTLKDLWRWAEFNLTSDVKTAAAKSRGNWTTWQVFLAACPQYSMLEPDNLQRVRVIFNAVASQLLPLTLKDMPIEYYRDTGDVEVVAALIWAAGLGNNKQFKEDVICPFFETCSDFDEDDGLFLAVDLVMDIYTSSTTTADERKMALAGLEYVVSNSVIPDSVYEQIKASKDQHLNKVLADAIRASSELEDTSMGQAIKLKQTADELEHGH